MTAPHPVFKLPEFTGFSERQWQQYALRLNISICLLI
jgi:hypothetical protein